MPKSARACPPPTTANGFVRRGFVISALPYPVIMIIPAALFISFGYKLIFKEEPNASPSTQLPPDVQNQQADETANWKTYTDPEGAFSFKYPPNLVIQPIFNRELIGFKS